ncbi:MAG: hypothetical protein IT292_03680 [Deltaproteobacteria bacterium]|nr:hypothetical protein [Deltaproteobacteria bacterium]
MPGMVCVRLPYRRLQKNVFSHLEEDQVTLKGKLTSIASDGLQFVPCPLAPLSEDDLNKVATSTSWVNLSPEQMYLSHAVPAHRQRKSPQLKYATQRGNCVTVVSDKLALAGVAARCFVYLGGSVSQIVQCYNMCLAIGGLLKAAFASSPFHCAHPMPQQAMETIMHGDGLDSFRASRQDSGLCPFDGVSYLNSRTPQLNVMLYYGSMINSRPFLLETYTDRGPYGAMKAWLSHNWTCAAGILLDEE